MRFRYCTRFERVKNKAKALPPLAYSNIDKNSNNKIMLIKMANCGQNDKELSIKGGNNAI